MSPGLLLLHLVQIIATYFIGIYIYTQGFLLKRHALSDRSEACGNYTIGHSDIGHSCQEMAFMDPPFQKCVLLVIDALRYDFIEWRDDLENSSLQVPPYINQLPAIRDLLEVSPGSATTYKFLADPPTTTLQRLQGITTGTLPTFIDAGSNFAGGSMMEDNWLDQAVAHGKRIVFMGDDTWSNLYPTQFHMSYPYPSFDVQDLDTVDNGVLRHLEPTLALNDSDIVIGHFLGVDHCGHKYGPFHPEIQRKLRQMNDVIRKVANNYIDEDTVLFVMGDHGMTKTGDHGGDSEDELTAGLLVYSPRFHHLPKHSGTIPQINLVPTLSVLLGLPIPFSNLGVILQDLWPSADTAKTALRQNVVQVRTYLNAYIGTGAISSTSNLFHLADRLWKLLEAHTKPSSDDQRKYQWAVNATVALHDALELFREVWVRFNVPRMILGIILILVNLTGSIGFLLLGFKEVLGFSAVGALFGGVILLVCVYEDKDGLYLVAFGCIILLLMLMLAVWSLRGTILRTATASRPYFSAAVFIAYCVSLTSNSFVVYGDVTVQFICKSLVLLILLNRLRACSHRRYFRAALILEHTLIGVAVCLLLRGGSAWNRCREEQFGCEQSLLIRPLEGNEDYWIKLARLASAAGAVIFIAFSSLRMLLIRTGQARANHFIAVRYSTLLWLLVCLIISHWCLECVPLSTLTQLGAIELLPALVTYAIYFAILAALLMGPVTNNIKPDEMTTNCVATTPSMGPSIPTSQLNSCDPAHFAYPLNLVSTSPQIACQDTRPPHDSRAHETSESHSLVAYITEPLLLTMVATSMICMLISGPGIALSYIMLLVVLILLLELGTGIPGDDIQLVILISMISSHFFFATGHHQTFPSVPWKAAFVGLPGNFKYHFLPALLIIIHCFGASIICTMAVPLIALWNDFRNHCNWSRPHGNYLIYKSGSGLCLASAYSREGHREGSAGLGPGSPLLVHIHRLLVMYITVEALKFFSTVICTSIHRRHLMVWKIFAPMFIYQGSCFIVVCVSALLIYCIMWRLNALAVAAGKIKK